MNCTHCNGTGVEPVKRWEDSDDAVIERDASASLPIDITVRESQDVDGPMRAEFTVK